MQKQTRWKEKNGDDAEYGSFPVEGRPGQGPNLYSIDKSKCNNFLVKNYSLDPPRFKTNHLTLLKQTVATP